jgi:hypothetical protein
MRRALDRHPFGAFLSNPRSRGASFDLESTPHFVRCGVGHNGWEAHGYWPFGATQSVDNFESAKKLLEPKGMTVVEAKVDQFRKVAQERVWPAYKNQFGALWDEITDFKS